MVAAGLFASSPQCAAFASRGRTLQAVFEKKRIKPDSDLEL